MIIRFKNILAPYLFITGIICHFIILAAIFLIPVFFQEPVSFFWERAVNILTNSNSGKTQKIAIWIMKKNIVPNWKQPSQKEPTFISTIASWNGQGAYSNVNNKNHTLAEQSQYYIIRTSKELLSAIEQASPGDIIHLAPGFYYFQGRNININTPGMPHKPITIRSNKLGLAKLKFDLIEGFHVKAPYWKFENLEIQGVCNNDSHCEHAFHIVGKANSIILRNNIIYDFNAPLKVNGLTIDKQTFYPDSGLVEKNTIYNNRSRNTDNPVTLLNIDSVNNWIVRGNLIADFSKGSGDKVSYGAYMKGNGKNGLFENNLVICEMNLVADQGLRIGLSLGGGGTSKAFCRDQDCTTEFTDGIIRNNIIAHCSHDVGIYLNKAADTIVYNNLLYNNLGIDVRFSSSTAKIFNNIISGRIKKRDNGQFMETNNIIDSNCLSTIRNFSNCSFKKWFWDISALDLTLIDETAQIIGTGIYYKNLTKDFCNNPLSRQKIDIGPIQYSNYKKCTPNIMH